MAKAKDEAKPNEHTAEEQAEMFDGPAVASLQDSDVLASLSAFARAFGTDRETLRRRLTEADIQPVAERSGHKLYRLRDAYQAWALGPEGPVDPDKLSPFNRRAWYQGELDKLALQQRRGDLVAAMEVEQSLGRFAKLFLRDYETIGDELERDVGLTPQQAARLEQILDRRRVALYEAIAGTAEDEGAGGPTQTSAASAAPAISTAPANVPRGTSGSAVDDAVRFLRAELAAGARPTAELIEAGKSAGLSEATLRRAKKQLGAEISARREGRGWVWELEQPDQDG